MVKLRKQRHYLLLVSSAINEATKVGLWPVLAIFNPMMTMSLTDGLSTDWNEAKNLTHQ